MAGAIMEKVWGLFGMEPAEDRDEEIEEVDTEEVENDEEEQERIILNVMGIILFCFIGNSEGTSYEIKGTACRRCALARR